MNRWGNTQLRICRWKEVKELSWLGEELAKKKLWGAHPGLSVCMSCLHVWTHACVCLDLKLPSHQAYILLVVVIQSNRCVSLHFKSIATGSRKCMWNEWACTYLCAWRHLHLPILCKESFGGVDFGDLQSPISPSYKSDPLQNFWGCFQPWVYNGCSNYSDIILHGFVQKAARKCYNFLRW